ncbi:hypothetical protein [Halomonas sp. DQ26W]|uniref:hypothetical protein n=1 Tax=Halomonas sp. DQ26W TaxID=2282311 RepID=UPI0011C05691|nr:hypothetical protein [Halomonas sp. DQ26W]
MRTELLTQRLAEAPDDGLLQVGFLLAVVTVVAQCITLAQVQGVGSNLVAALQIVDRQSTVLFTDPTRLCW